MSNELILRVNENDLPIGVVNRAEAHKDSNIWHREVGLIVVDDNNKVLFQQRALDRRVLPGYWSTGVAGHVDPEESSDEAIIRESYEEIGLTVNLDELIYLGKEPTTIEDEFRNESHYKHWYVLKVANSSQFLETLQIDQNEVNAVEFWSREEIEQNEAEGFLLYVPYLTVVKKYLDNKIDLIQNEGDSNAQSYR